MIENLNGIYETVNFKKNTSLRLYHNRGTEDYPNHWHTPIEIIMPYDNEYQVTVGTRRLTLSAGDIIIICPGVLHAVHAPEYGRRFIFQADLSPLTSIKSFGSLLSLIFPFTIITQKKDGDFYEQVKHILEQVDESYRKDTVVTELEIYALLMQLFILIGNSHDVGMLPEGADSAHQIKYREKFVTVCNYINEHCTEDLTLDMIASLAGFSKFHFTRLFKQFTGVSFHKYLNRQRITYAQTLLLDPDMSITQITFQTGFASMSSFIRMFKIFNSCTPSEYRQMRITFD